MGWRDVFRRRASDRATGPTRRDEEHLPLPSAEPVESWRRRLDAAGLRLLGVERQPMGTYLTLAGDDPEAAKRYLRQESVTPAAKGFVDNWVALVECGACEHEWIDGLRYCSHTLVRCPDCRKANVVDSTGYTYQEY